MTPLSLQQYLAREETLRGLDPQLARVISGISEACKTISSLVRQGALAGVLGLAGSENVQGEEQKKLDIISNDIFVEALVQTGAVCGIKLPEGLRMGEKLPEPIFTPAGKAAVGTHDENITFERVVELYGEDIANKIRSATLELYRRASEYAATKGIIIADTKFEFGLDAEGNVRLMDEVLTPDSSRFWPAESYEVGMSPPSFDKQFIRDWLEAQPWDKTPPAPRAPAEIIEKTADKYREALRRLADTDIE